MTLFSKANLATIAIVTGMAVTAGTSGAVAGAMITGKQIKNNTVTTKDIKDDNLKGSDVLDGSLSIVDLAPSARGVTGVVVVTGQKIVPANNFDNLTVVCPAGTKVLSADGWWNGHNEAVQADTGTSTQAAFFATPVDSLDVLRGRILCGVY